MLPEISIKTDVKPRDFIKRLEDIAKKDHKISEVKKEIDFLGEKGVDILSLKPKEQLGHTDIFGQLITDSELKDRVKVEIRALQWKPHPPTYDIYVGEAKRIIDSLLKKYNKKYNSLRRLKIKSEKSMEPTLPASAKKLFDSFTKLANKNALHPLDWKRFYGFIRFCHARHIKLDDFDLRYLLLAEGFKLDVADYLSDIYHHCRKMLKVPIRL